MYHLVQPRENNCTARAVVFQGAQLFCDDTYLDYHIKRQNTDEAYGFVELI